MTGQSTTCKRKAEEERKQRSSRTKVASESLYHGLSAPSYDMNRPEYLPESSSTSFKIPSIESSSLVGASSLPIIRAPALPISVCVCPGQITNAVKLCDWWFSTWIRAKIMFNAAFEAE